MKNRIPLILILIFLNSNIFAQTDALKAEENKKSTTYLDILLNVVTTDFNYGKSNSILKKYKKEAWGLQLGASFQAGITQKFSLVPEFYFIMKGGTLKANNPITTPKSTLRLYVLELPLMARYHMGKFYLNAGPSIAYNLYGKTKVEGSTVSPEKTTALAFDNSSQAFDRWDAGVQIGGGYMWRLKKVRIALDIRYCYGFTNISHDRQMYNRLLNINMLISKPWKTNPFEKKENIID